MNVGKEENDDQILEECVVGTIDEDFNSLCGNSSLKEHIEVNEQTINAVKDVLQENCEVNYESALQLNKEMQLRLAAFRDRVVKLLSDANQEISENEKSIKEIKAFLSKRPNGFKKGIVQKGRTFFYYGSTFFRDNYRNAPNNKDYERRRAKGEMFPQDISLYTRHLWSLSDKTSLLKGVKRQVIDHLDQSIRWNPKRAKKDIMPMHSDKLVNLLNEVDDQFKIDWNEISLSDLQRRHCSFTCEALWNSYMKPELKRSAWSKEESNNLLKIAQAHNFHDWDAISLAHVGRSALQCFLQYQNWYFHPTREGVDRWSRWTAEEDEILREAMKQFSHCGKKDWSAISARLPNKTRSSIMERFMYRINPEVSHESFTKGEDLLLIAAVEEYGKKFHKFPRNLFPNRTTVQLRTRYVNTLEHRHKQSMWTLEDDKLLLNFVKEKGQSSWMECSKYLNERHTRTSCRTRFMTIIKFLKANPNKTIDHIQRRSTRINSGDVTTLNWFEKINRDVDKMDEDEYVTDNSDVRTEEPDKRKTSLKNRGFYRKRRYEQTISKVRVSDTTEQSEAKSDADTNLNLKETNFSLSDPRIEKFLISDTSSAPDAKRDLSWTYESDKTLLQFVKNHGVKSWLECSQLFPFQTEINCHDRYFFLIKRLRRNPFIDLKTLSKKRQRKNKKKKIRIDPPIDLVEYLWRRARKRQKKFKPTVQQERMNAGPIKQERKKLKPKKKISTMKILIMKRKKSVILKKRTVLGGDNIRDTRIKKSRQNPLYVQRLRGVERQIYDCAKYSYNFRFGCENHRSALNLQSIITKRFTTNVDHFLRANVSTIMAFRALCMLHSKFSNVKIESNIEENEVFVNRFHSCFLKVAALSRISVNELYPILNSEDSEDSDVLISINKNKCNFTDDDIKSFVILHANSLGLIAVENDLNNLTLFFSNEYVEVFGDDEYIMTVTLIKEEDT